MYKIIILLMIIIGNLSFSERYPVDKIHKDIDKLFSIVPDKHHVEIDGEIYYVDLRRLILQTAMIESNFGRDNYKGRIAKTYMQIEEETADWYLSRSPELKSFLEKKLGRKLIWNRDKDAVFIAYLVYMNKFETHKSWLNKFKDSKHFKDKDIEYYLYKIFFNSILGASTFARWESREREYYELKYSEYNG